MSHPPIGHASTMLPCCTNKRESAGSRRVAVEARLREPRGWAQWVFPEHEFERLPSQRPQRTCCVHRPEPRGLCSDRGARENDQNTRNAESSPANSEIVPAATRPSHSAADLAARKQQPVRCYLSLCAQTTGAWFGAWTGGKQAEAWPKCSALCHEWDLDLSQY